MSNRSFFFAATLVLGSAWSGPAGAGGLVVPGTGTEAMGRAGAFAAKADDPSALHHNPAGFAKQSGTVIYLGTNLVHYALSFDRDGVYEAPAEIAGEPLDPPDYVGQEFGPVENGARPGLGVGRFQAIPLFVVASDLAGAVPGLRLALGVMAPNAYPNRDFGDYEFEAPGVAPPPQRYDVVEQEALVVLPSLAAAYSVLDSLDVGVRVSWGIASLRAESYTWGIENYEEWIGDDGRFVVDVKDDFTSAFESAPVPVFSAGVLYRPLAALEFGASYASAIHIDARGTGTATLGANRFNGEPQTIAPLTEEDLPRCSADGTRDALATCLSFGLPQTARLAARWIAARDPRGAEIADVEFDVVWEDWSSASDYEVIVDGLAETAGRYLETGILRHGLRDALSLRLGGSYALPVADRSVVVRAGLAHDTAAAPDSWQRVDFDGAARTTVAAGATWQGGRIRVDVAAAAVFEGDRTVPSCNPTGSSPGCPPGAGQTPVAGRDAPDPVQPIVSPSQQVQNPFNGGDYASRYLMFSLAASTRF